MRVKAQVFPLFFLIFSCCANRVSEEYRGEKEPKGRRGNPALPDWISLVPWYVSSFTHPKRAVVGRGRGFAAREREREGLVVLHFRSKSEQMVIVFSLFLMVCFICAAGSSLLAVRAPLWPDGNKPQQ